MFSEPQYTDSDIFCYNYFVPQKPVFEEEERTSFPAHVYEENGVLYCATATKNRLYRYMYCLNNPLVYTDPSGESWKSFWNKVGNWMNENNISFNVGYNTTYGSFHNFGNSGNIYHNQPGGNANTIVNGAINNARAKYYDYNNWQSSGLDDILNQSFVGQSPLAGGVAVNQEGLSLDIINDRVSKAAFLISAGSYNMGKEMSRYAPSLDGNGYTIIKPSINYKGWYVGLGKGLRITGMYAGIGTTLYSGYQTIKNPTAENIANTTFGAIGFLGVPGMVVSGMYTYSVDYSIPAYIQRKTTYENKYGTPYIEYEGLCFEGMTKIKMGDGSEKTIKEINVGDIIKTYDFRNKKITSTKVLKVDSRIHNNLIEISFSNNITNINTQDHPYYVKGKGWCSFNPIQSAERYDLTTTKLEIGDKCFIYQKGNLKKLKVISIIKKEGAEKTYNLTDLKVGNSYFANGVLVNNESKE